MFSQAVEDTHTHTHTKLNLEICSGMQPLQKKGQRVSAFGGIVIKPGEPKDAHVHRQYAMHSGDPKTVAWKNRYWCPVISTLLRRGSVTQPVYNSPRTL